LTAASKQFYNLIINNLIHYLLIIQIFNQMKKVTNFSMFWLLLALGLATVVFNSCGDDEEPIPTPPSPPQPTTVTVPYNFQITTPCFGRDEATFMRNALSAGNVSAVSGANPGATLVPKNSCQDVSNLDSESINNRLNELVQLSAAQGLSLQTDTIVTADQVIKGNLDPQLVVLAKMCVLTK
jgi:hypothetical protein